MAEEQKFESFNEILESVRAADGGEAEADKEATAMDAVSLDEEGDDDGYTEPSLTLNGEGDEDAGDNDDVPLEDGGDEEEDRPQKQESRAQKRIRQLSEEKNELKAKFEQSDRRFEELSKKHEATLQFLEKVLSGQQDQQGEEDPYADAIDSDVIQKLRSEFKQEIEGIKQQGAKQSFESALREANNIGQSTTPDFGKIYEHVLFSVARQAKAQAELFGEKYTDEQYIRAAVEQIQNEQKALFNKTKDPRKMAAYIATLADQYGYQPQDQGKKNTGSRVNMDEVDRARREAGRAQVRKASAGNQPANMSGIMNMVRKEAGL